MRPGDRVFIYHSGGNSAVVGLAAVRGEPRADPKNSKSAVVELEFTARLEPPTTLVEIKQSGKFADWALVRQGRLSPSARARGIAAGTSLDTEAPRPRGCGLRRPADLADDHGLPRIGLLHRLELAKAEIDGGFDIDPLP